MPEAGPPRVIGRYALHGEIASGGMATVHYGRLLGAEGFSRIVAIKRLHGHHAKDPDFVAALLDEARIAARIRHPNVVTTLDVVKKSDEILLVMEYVHGDTLSRLAKAAKERGETVPPHIVTAVVAGALRGLHAAHEARDERGAPLAIVHRDVSPQNIHVGVDGVARVLDFGVAKAEGRAATTRDGQLKGKLAYMAPEQITGAPVTPKVDVFAASIVLWELLTGERLFFGDNEGMVLNRVLTRPIEPPSALNPAAPRELDAIVLRGLSRNVDLRFATAKEMATALEREAAMASAPEIGEWVEHVAARSLAERAARVAALETTALGPEESVVARRPPELDEPTPTPEPTPAPGTPVPPEELSRMGVSVVEGAPPARSGAPFALLGLFLVGSVIALVAILGLRRQAPAAAGPPEAPSSVPAAAASPTPSEPAPTPSAEPPPAPVAEVASAAPSSAPSPRPPTAKPSRPHRASPRAAGKPSCDPPFVIDASGHKQFKLECL